MYQYIVPTKIMAGLLIVLLVSAIPVKSQSNNRNEAFARLLKLAKERDKVLAKQQKEIHERLLTVSRDVMKAYNKGRREDAVYYSREGDAFVKIKDSIGRERDVIQVILSIERYGNSDNAGRIERAMTFGMSAGGMKRVTDEVTRKEIEARVRLELAQSKGIDAELIALMRREVAAYQKVFAALDQEEEMLDQYLAVFGRTSVKQIQKNQEAALEAERSRYRRIERERERAKEYAAALVVAVGVVAALVVILKSPDSTSAHRKEAEDWLKALKEQARTTCAFRGGIFLDGGPYSIGTCSK